MSRHPSPPIGAHSLILGAGSLGRLWGALLPDGSVTLVPRSAPAGTRCHFQFQPMTGPARRIALPWATAATDLTHADLILVTTKAQDAPGAIESLRHRVPASTPLVLFQNGLGSQQTVCDRFPDHPVLAASTTEGANRADSDTLTHAGTGDTWVGALNDAGSAVLADVVRYLQAGGLRIHAEPMIETRLWQKLVINAGINPFTAILDCPNGDILDHPFYRERIDTLCRELLALMRHEGLPATSSDALRDRIETVARATASNTSSMRADIRHRRKTEIDFINGFVATRCEALNLSARVNRELTNRVKELEPE